MTPPHQAPVNARLDTSAERSLAAPGLLAQIIVAKYCDHLPLYRQEQLCRLRHGIELPRQSLARWLMLAAQWLVPVYERIHTGVMAGGHVQTDETVVKYLESGHGQTRQGFLWTLKQPQGDAVFVWRTSRAAQCLSDIVPGGLHRRHRLRRLQRVSKPRRTKRRSRPPGRVLGACAAQVRRGRESSPQRAGIVLLLIQRLYQVEKQLREKRASAKLRQVARGSHSRMIVERLGALLLRWQDEQVFLPQSLMGKAVAYTLTLWPHLQNYLEDGRVEIDNNLVENAIRPTAVGKKNWLFFGDTEAGQASAVLFTIIKACRRRKIDPWEYLRDVLTRLPSMTTRQIGEVMPDAWIKAKAQAGGWQSSAVRPMDARSQAAA